MQTLLLDFELPDAANEVEIAIGDIAFQQQLPTLQRRPTDAEIQFGLSQSYFIGWGRQQVALELEIKVAEILEEVLTPVGIEVSPKPGTAHAEAPHPVDAARQLQLSLIAEGRVLLLIALEECLTIEGIPGLEVAGSRHRQVGIDGER